MVNSEIIYPLSATFKDEMLSIQFENDLTAIIKVEEKQSHITFEIIEFNNPENVELLSQTLKIH